jgi:hypothetical protein
MQSLSKSKSWQNGFGKSLLPTTIIVPEYYATRDKKEGTVSFYCKFNCALLCSTLVEKERDLLLMNAGPPQPTHPMLCHNTFG